MPTPCLYHAGASLLGMIQDIEWGEWLVAVQRASAFGVDGTSVIHGGLVIREFTVPMIVMGYASTAQRDGDLAQFELRLGKVGMFQADTAFETVAYLPDVRMAALRQGLGRSDAIHGYWRQIWITFEQLRPPA